MPADLRDQPPDQLPDRLRTGLAGVYAIERELGGGGMARVFVATETALGRRVVVKVLPPPLAAAVSVERFAREIQLAATLQQANIVPLLAAGVADGIPYYTMPYVEGRSLRERLAEGRGPVPVPEAVGIVRDVLRALEYAHARGIVHRDIKPENVLLSGGTAVVADLGLARALSAARTHEELHGGEGAASAVLTREGVGLGTPAYAAPEQTLGDPATDHRADLYAVGCVAYELLTGTAPFAGRGVHQLVAAHVAEPVPSVLERRPDCPPALAALVARLVAKQPDARPASAREALDALDALDALAEAAAGERGAAPARRRRRWRRAAVVLLALLAASGLVGWFGALSPDERATLRVLAARDPVGLRVNRVVVAPLRNQTGDPALAVLGPLVADVLTTGLSSLPSLDVVDARTAAASGEVVRRIPRLFRRGDAGLAVADEVGAGVLIDGSYYRDGDSVRVRARVLDAATGAVRKALPEVTVAPAAPEAGLRRLTERTVAFLRGVSDPEMPVGVREFDVPLSLAAANEVFAGYAAYLRRDTSGVRHFDRVVALDTGWVGAYVVRAWMALELYGAARPRLVDSAFAAAERRTDRMAPVSRALFDMTAALGRGDAAGYLEAAERYRAGSPTSPEGRYLVASAALLARRPERALAMFRSVDPDRGIAIPLAEMQWTRTAMAAAQLGDWASARAAAAEARRRVPGSGRAWSLDAVLAGAQGDAAGVEGARRRAVRAIDVAGSVGDASALALLATRGGGLAEARALARRWSREGAVVAPTASPESRLQRVALHVLAEDWPGALAETAPAAWAGTLARGAWTDTAAYLGVRGVALARAGRADEARAAEARVAAYEPRRWGAGIATLARARIAAHLGETERAVSLTERAIERGALAVIGGLRTADSDPFLLPLRDDVRFGALARPAALER